MSDRPAETEYSALQALLQIRTEGNASADAGDNQAASQAAAAPAAPAPGASLSPTAPINANAKFANLLRMGASSAILQQAQQMAYRQPVQLAALRATAAAATLQTPNSLLLQNPTFAGNPAITSPFLDAMARDPALVAAAAVANAPRSPALDLPRSPALSPRVAALSHAGATISPAQHTLPEIASTGKPEDAREAERKIRKDEVAAALRSKPQRGRKRENLNAEERLELTRTRNREHAKSTRIRKKARYQELLDTEQKYLDLQKLQQLAVKRQETVQGFLDARVSMLQVAMGSTLQPKQVSPNSEKGTEEKGPSSESRGVSFDGAEAFPRKTTEDGTTTPKAGLKVDDTSKRLMVFLKDENSFGFETSLGDTIQATDSSAMSRFDEHVAKRLEQVLGPVASDFKIDYRVLGANGGVALNHDGTGFARVEYVLSRATSKDVKLIFSSLVSFEFAEDSHLIRSVAWSILKDSIGITGGESFNCSKSDSTAKESLESQTVYPSVVSFDEAALREKAKELATAAAQSESEVGPNHRVMDNPGMSI